MFHLHLEVAAVEESSGTGVHPSHSSLSPAPAVRSVRGRVHLYRRAFDESSQLSPSSSSSLSPPRVFVLCLPSSVPTCSVLSLGLLPSSTPPTEVARHAVVADGEGGQRSWLLEMSDAVAAQRLYRDLNGRPFPSSASAPSNPQGERCLAFLLHSATEEGGVQGGGGGSAADGEEGGVRSASSGWAAAAAARGWVELPRCPRCLLRLDTSATGVVPSFDSAAAHQATLLPSSAVHRRRRPSTRPLQLRPPPPSLPTSSVPSATPAALLSLSASAAFSVAPFALRRPRSSSDGRLASAKERSGTAERSPRHREVRGAGARAVTAAVPSAAAAAVDGPAGGSGWGTWPGIGCDVCQLLDVAAASQCSALSTAAKAVVSVASAPPTPSPSPVRCAECAVTGDVREAIWVCLVCGHRGCGRYFQGHAAAHFASSQHRYCIELLQHYIWDYHADGFCHRVKGRERERERETALVHSGGGPPSAAKAEPSAALASLVSSAPLPSLPAPASTAPQMVSVPPARSRYQQGLYDSDAEVDGEMVEDEGLTSATQGEGSGATNDDDDFHYWLSTEDVEGGDLHSPPPNRPPLGSSASDDEGGGGGDEGLLTGKLSSIASHYSHLLSSELMKQAAFYDAKVQERVEAMDAFAARNSAEERRLQAELTAAVEAIQQAERELRQRAAAAEERGRRNGLQRTEVEFVQQLNHALIADQQRAKKELSSSPAAPSPSRAPSSPLRPRVLASLQSKQRQIDGLQSRIAQLMEDMDRPATARKSRAEAGRKGK